MKKTTKRIKLFLRFISLVFAILIGFGTLNCYAVASNTDASADNVSSGEVDFSQTDISNTVSTAAYNNGVITVSDTDVVVSIGGHVNVSYSFSQSGYTVTTYHEGAYLFRNTVEDAYVTITGLYPGKSGMMLYYCKKDGDTIVDEGAVIINILVRPNEGYVNLKNVLSGKGADVAGGKAKEGAKVIIWTINSSFQANQVWKIIPNNEGTCSIRSELGSGYYLSRNTETNRLEISTTQAFWVLQYSPHYESYYIVSPSGTYYACVEDDATTSGSYLCCSTSASSASAKWLVQYQTSYVPVSGVSIVDPGVSTANIDVGDDYDLAIQVLPSNASCPEYTVSSSNTESVVIENSNRIVARELGTATITVKTVSGGKTDMLTVTVVSAPMVSHQGTIYLGLASEDYISGCVHDDRHSSTYAEIFKSRLCTVAVNNPKTVYLEQTSGADKRLFLQESDGGFSKNIEDVDFMIFIGHGLGNNLHFLSSPDGATHSDLGTDSRFNFDYTEARFGESGGRIKWFFAYTCNFLATGGSCVSDISELYPMLEGAHIILGGGTGMVLNSEMAQDFSVQLNQGNTIIDSYFSTATNQSEYYKSPGILRAIYALEARNDTLFEYARDVKGYSEGERYGVKSIPITPANG